MKSFESLSGTESELAAMSMNGLCDVIDEIELRFVRNFVCSGGASCCTDRQNEPDVAFVSCRRGGILVAGTSHDKTCNPMPAFRSSISSSIASVHGMSLESVGRMPEQGVEWMEPEFMPAGNPVIPKVPKAGGMFTRP
jgi:hypothetical protein